MKFVFTSEQDGETVTVAFEAVTLSEIEEMYKRFLRGAGFWIREEDDFECYSTDLGLPVNSEAAEGLEIVFNPKFENAPSDTESNDEQPPIYYMRDNHTYKRLTEDVEIAMNEIAADFKQGYDYGMLCSKREGFTNISSNGSRTQFEFFNECRKVLTKEFGA